MQLLKLVNDVPVNSSDAALIFLLQPLLCAIRQLISTCYCSWLCKQNWNAA